MLCRDPYLIGYFRDTGYTKPSFFNPVGKLQTPSNVTRLSRSLRRICTDGTIQIIEYHSGLGTGGTVADLVSGGAFGQGISENIHSSYSFICANYRDGDEIILIGFSRLLQLLSQIATTP